jgi:signal transduction histidine kinase
MRLSAWAPLAIVLAAAILAVLGYLSLRHWQASSEMLFQQQSREMAAMAAEKVRMVLAQAEDEVVSRLRAVVARPDFAADMLQDFLAAAPLVERLYIFDRRGRLLYPATFTGRDASALAAIPGEISEGLWEREGRAYLGVGGEAMLATVLKTAGAPVLAAFSRNPEVLRREILAKTLGGMAGPSIVAVIDEQERPVYSPGPLGRADRVVTVSLGAELPSWRVALYQPAGLSPREATRRQIALFTVAFGLLLLVIVGGLVATYRLVRRETQIARLKADFVANVSHDLKTPLSLIRMFGETLELGRVTDEGQRQEYYRVITRESERLSRLIDNVLDFSRIDGGRRTYDIVPTAVEPLVRDTLEAFDYVLRQQGFAVDVRIDPDLADAPLDGNAVGQALANLVDNAIKYSAKRKALTVEARLDSGQLALAVADEGIGIPPAEQERIFEKFYRVGRSDTQDRRGSGVGLTLVRHIVEAHGGRVTVESEPGRGSRFTLWFPLAHSSPAPTAS